PRRKKQRKAKEKQGAKGADVAACTANGQLACIYRDRLREGPSGKSAQLERLCEGPSGKFDQLGRLREGPSGKSDQLERLREGFLSGHDYLNGLREALGSASTPGRS